MVPVYTIHQLRARLTAGKHERLDAVLRQCATLYNAGLQERRDAYKMAGASVSLYNQTKQFTAIRADMPEWSALDVNVGRGVLRRLDRAFNAFFRRVKAGETPGFPRFKSGRRWRTIDLALTRPGMVKVSEDGRKAYIRVKGLPVIELRLRRPLPPSEHLKTLRLVKRPTGWYADLGFKVEKEPLPANDRAVGIDLGVNNRMALSDGTFIDRRPSVGRRKRNRGRSGAPRSSERKRQASGQSPDALWTLPDENPVITLQRRIARCKRGSRRQRALRQQLARLQHRNRVRNRNECHRITTDIVRQYGRIAMEKLQVKNMTASASGTVEEPGTKVAQKSGLNREILSQTWGLIREQLRYKAAWAGREFVEVNPRYTSRECWSCGEQTPQSEYRTYRCGVCGTTFDRDTNAAINVMQRAFGPAAIGAGITPTLL